MTDNSTHSLLKQPLSVWVLAFACTVSYMGIGLVDPILPTIAKQLHATPGQSELLFTSYLFVTAVVMYFSAWVSSKLGTKKTLIAGILLIVIFAAACSVSGTINQIIGFRAGWGLGNALYVSTALSAIVAASTASHVAIIFYEAAVGLGFAIGPLVGGLLGEVSWRAPFGGAAILMGVALIAIVVLLKVEEEGAQKTHIGFLDGVKGAFHPSMRWLAIGALFYFYAFMTVLTYGPFPVEHAAQQHGIAFTPIHLGFVFFGWGVGLAISSVWLAPKIADAFGLRNAVFGTIGLLTILLLAMALFVHNMWITIGLVVLSGFVLGTANTLLTTLSMKDSDLPRPVASSAYSGTRFIGSALAPTLVGPLSRFGVGAPLLAGAVAAVLSIVILARAVGTES